MEKTFITVSSANANCVLKRMVLLQIFLFSLSFASGHVISTSRFIEPGGYHMPFASYQRNTRESNNPMSEEDALNLLKSTNILKSPSLRHKFLSQPGGQRSFFKDPLPNFVRLNTNYKPVDFSNIVKDIENHEKENNLEEEADDKAPEYVPYIGARAFSNMDMFFQHLRDNIAALEVKKEESNSHSKAIAPIRYGDFDSGAPKSRLSFRPALYPTNIGLGRK